MNELPPEKRDIAMVFQFYALYPALTVGQNIAMPLHYEKLDKAARTHARQQGRRHPAPDARCSTGCPDQISEGEKQRVAVARAIVRDPNCFLFDEPLSRLDVELRQSMRGQIKEVLSDLSKATVIVTHDQLEALTMADRIAIMKDGLIEQVGTPHEVFAKPANVFVASFIGTPQMNLIPASVKSIDSGKARLIVGAEEIGLNVGGAASRLQSGNVTIGIRPRALLPVSDSVRGYSRRRSRVGRADGCRNAYSRTRRGGPGSSHGRAARKTVQDRRQGAACLRSDANAYLRQQWSGGAGMSEIPASGMKPGTARALEFTIIGIGVAALLLIFQPFSLTLFGIGCGLVVFAGLANNLLPLAAPGVPASSVVRAGIIVVVLFLVVTALSIGAAYLYGLYLQAR